MAHMEAAEAERMKSVRSGERLAMSSNAMAVSVASQTEVVTASNMFEFGQRSETHQRQRRAAVWRVNATAKKPSPAARAAGHLYAMPMRRSGSERR